MLSVRCESFTGYQRKGADLGSVLPHCRRNRSLSRLLASVIWSGDILFLIHPLAFTLDKKDFVLLSVAPRRSAFEPSIVSGLGHSQFYPCTVSFSVTNIAEHATRSPLELLAASRKSPVFQEASSSTFVLH